MDFDLSPEQEAFREEVRAFIAEYKPDNPHDGAQIERWHTAVREKRWVGFSWPAD